RREMGQLLTEFCAVTGYTSQIRADAAEGPAGRPAAHQANTPTLTELWASGSGPAAAVPAGDGRHLLQTSCAFSAAAAGTAAAAAGAAAVSIRRSGACGTHEWGDRRSRTQASARTDQSAARHQHHQSRHAAQTPDCDPHLCRVDGGAARVLRDGPHRPLW